MDIADVSVQMQLSAAVSIEAAGMPPADSSHAQRVLSLLNQQRAVGKFCDAMLNVGGGVVYLAHRNILACFSELVQLQSSVPAASCTEFCLRECPNDGLELLLNFVYTGELKLDAENLDKVQQAAASLSVPDALTLCQQFRDTPVDPAPLKRKRGRPRKSATDTTPSSSVKEENSLTIIKDESCLDTAAANSSTSTTTTRSGRVVKGPRRLVTDESLNTGSTATERDYENAPLILMEGEGGEIVVERQTQDQQSGETEVTELQIDLNEKSVSQVLENIGGDDDDDDDVGGFEGANEDTDEEYVPIAEPSSSAPSVSTARKRKAGSKTDKKENGEAMEDESKKDCVQCPVCAKSFKSKYYLKVHNRRHTGERPFGCVKCGKRYFRKENLLIHDIRDCSKVHTLTCVTCSATFTAKEELRLHVVTHTGNMPYKCSTCTEQFMYKKNLTTHLMKVHGHPKPHACPQCPKTFLTKTELRVHEAAKHRGEKPFVCEECGHRASSRNGLQMHIKAIHRNERPFVCSLCSHAFSQKNNLNMHLRIHSGERPYQCHLCGKTFRTQASLDKHNRTHTGERPFGCEVCEQRFTEKGALLRHKASKHEEGRPHCCDICGKTFKAKEQLRVHLRRHKGMRKFECSDCGYKFTRQAHLRRHVQIHKRTENYNPRQRKLRNVIVQEVDNSPEAADPSLIADDADYNPETDSVQESTNPEPTLVMGLGSSCIVRVVIEPRDAVMEGVVSDQSLGHVEAGDGFTVQGVLQQTQLDSEAYESTIDMEGIVQNMTEDKT
ncbi:telomere zinc finger-associated protein isoform X2 [Notolabrus celidotus]|uniref:telomere zinc finger-associated protein isoform X2 n=1 Tax=Notolabrus celidotus TaxID=1203425 RepID=UPI00148F54DB|nr:telomere zinc finger-associated protein isoform X2 [Notolabrus celidotus]